MSNTRCTSSRSQLVRTRSPGITSIGTSRTSSVSWRFCTTCARCARNASPALPLTSSTRATSWSRSPNSDDPLGRGLLADARDVGQVVARVAAQGREVGVLRRGQAVLLLHRLGREPPHVRDALARVEHGDPVAHQLERVAVAGADQHVEAFALGPRRDGGDDVVGLVALGLQRRDAQRVEHLLDEVDLPAEVGRARAAVGLVVGEQLGAERLAGHVERDRDVRRVLVAHDVDQHRGEAVDGVGRLAGRGREVLDREGVERAVGQRVPVEQQQAVTGRLGRLIHAIEPSAPS